MTYQLVHYYKPDLDDIHGARGSTCVYDGIPVGLKERAYDGADHNLVSSEIDGTEGMHIVALDLDVEARLVPSSTGGHSHLFIEVPMTWVQYIGLLDHLASLGIVEGGYVEASMFQGKTLLRTKPRPNGLTVATVLPSDGAA